MGVIFTNGFGVGTVPNNTFGSSGRWVLATDGFGYQPAWTRGVVTVPIYMGNTGISDFNYLYSILTGNTFPIGLYINRYDSAGNDRTTLLESLVNNSGTIEFTQGSNYVIFSFDAGTFINGLNMFDSVFVDNNGGIPALTMIASSNTSFTGYPDGDNSSGPLTYNGSGIAPEFSQTIEITINVNPKQFTLTSDSFDQNGNFGPACNQAEGQLINFTGITVTNASNLYCGIYAHLSGYTQVEAAFNAAGAPMDFHGYVFDVVWGPGSTVTNGVAKVAYWSNSHQIDICPIDTTDVDYLLNDNDANNSTSLVGTFNFPATFTFRTPVISKGGWC